MTPAPQSHLRGCGAHHPENRVRSRRHQQPGQRVPHRTCCLFLFALLVLHSCVLHAAALETNADADLASDAPSIVETELIAVDLGHENMKVSAWRVQQQLQQQGSVLTDDNNNNADALGAPGLPPAVTGAVSMVLNDQTNRKSPPCVAFRYFRDFTSTQATTAASTDNASDAALGRPHAALHPRGYWLERTFAEQAQALAPRFPAQVVCSPAQLLGYAVASAGDVDALTASLSYQVMPLKPAANVTAAGRQALGAYVPFFSAAPTSAPRTPRGSGRDGAAVTEEGALQTGSLLSAEELTAMLLGYARRMAEKADAADNAISDDDRRVLAELQLATPQGATTQEGTDGDKQNTASATATARYAALTIPVHATVAQRQALMDAAAMAGLRVVRLVHSTTAAAVQLAYTKAEQVLRPDKPQYVMIYDMGSLQTDVAVYRFTAVPSSVATRTRVQASLELLALVGSRTLGGAALDRCIAAAWDARFFGGRVLGTPIVSSISTSTRTTTGDRADEDGVDVNGAAAAMLLAKRRGSLLRAAQRAKEMLSANQEALIAIDGVHANRALFDAAGQQQLQQRVVTVTPDGLLSVRATRAEFEETCRHVLDEAVALRDAAIAATDGVVANVSALDRLEVIGGGTRVPRLLQRLGEGYGASGVVDRTLNSDEAAVMGATLLAVSGATRTLHLRGSRTLPRYRVREWLTSTVYAAIALGNTTNVSELEHDRRALFPARNTTLPATRSVRVRLPLTQPRDDGAGAAATTSAVDQVAITLYADAETDAAHAGVKGRAGDSDALAHGSPLRECAGCFVQTCTITDVQQAVEALMRQRVNPRQRVQLTAAEVVVEVVATVSGIPHCSVAYVRAEVSVLAAAASSSPPRDAAADAPPQHAPQPEKSGEPHESADSKDGEDAEEEDGDVQPHELRQHTDATDPNAIASTTEADAAAAAASSVLAPSAQREVRVAPLPLRLSAGTPSSDHAGGAADRASSSAAPSAAAGYNMDFGELVASHRRVRALQAMDDVRLRRSTLRNDIESVLVWVKEHHADWDVVADAAAAPWQATVREVSEWLDDYGDTAGVAALEGRLRAITEVKRTLREQTP